MVSCRLEIKKQEWKNPACEIFIIGQVTSGNDDLQIALGKPTSATDWSNLKFGRKILSADVLKDKTISLDALTSADTDHNGVELKDKENSAAGPRSHRFHFSDCHICFSLSTARRQNICKSSLLL